MSRRQKRLRRPLAIDGVLDIETENWDRFVVGGLLDQSGRRFRSWSHRRESDLVNALLQTDGQVWAHNGGRFDALWFLQKLAERKIPANVTLAGARVLSVDVGRLTLRDSWALIPMSLSKGAEIGGVAKLSTGLDCICDSVDSCGGYCAIRTDLERPEMLRLVDYLEGDCRATWNMVRAVFAYAEMNGIELKATIGATAWATASKEAGAENSEWSPRLYQYLRDAYFGGRVQVFRPETPSGEHWDINSAYPAALVNTPIPTGAWREVSGAAARKAYRSGAPGIFRAVVEVPPDEFVPPLPARTGLRVAYPIGRIAGTWVALELRHAEAAGAEICDVLDGVVWKTEAPLMRGFCSRVWDLRHREGPKTAMGVFLKLLANSLTGKFAQKPETESIVMFPDADDVHECPADYECHGQHSFSNRKCCVHRCWKTCRVLTPVADSEFLFVRQSYRMAPSGHVEWAATLTADTRSRQLRNQLVADGQGGRTAVYCDTDSCFATAPRGGIGDGLGEWKPEGKFFDMEILAPKTYHYHDENGEVHGASKGVPDPVRNWAKMRTGVALNRGVVGLKTGARGGSLFRRKQDWRQVRADGVHFGDRILREDGLTYPRQMIDLVHDE